MLSLVLLLPAGCGGQHALQKALAPDSPAAISPQDAAALNKALAELDALEVPTGADAITFMQLKQALRTMLLERAQGKAPALAPTSARSKPVGFSLAGSGGTATVTWTYRNEGDFNLNSIVDVTDLTPMGVHFGKTSQSADWAQARVADGNQDGTISVADVVSIGANFGRRVDGYHLEYNSTFAGGSWGDSADIPFSTGTQAAGTSYRVFTISASSMVNGYYRVNPYDGSGEGIPSDAAAYPATSYYEVENNDDYTNADKLPDFPFPSPIVDGNLGTGNMFSDYDGDDVDWSYFIAPGDGTVDLSLILDGSYGDLDLYVYDSSATALVDLSETYADVEKTSFAVASGATYFVKVQRFSGYGEYRLAGTFTPQGANQPPVAAVVANPSSGTAPLAMTLNAGGSTDDGTIVKYEYDFGDGGGYQDFDTSNFAPHVYNTAGTFTAQVRITDDGGLSDTASTTVTVDPGSATVTVSGTILTDAGHPLPPVNLVLDDGGANHLLGWSFTDGTFRILDVPASIYTLVPSMEDITFDPASRSITVGAANITGQDFTAHFTCPLQPYPFRINDTPPLVVRPALDTTIDIYIEPGTGVQNYAEYMMTACLDALPRWNKVGDPWGLFHVQFTNNISNAEIWIHWVPSLGGSTAGVTYFSGTNGQINLPMEIQLATTVMSNQIDQYGEEMVSIHEVGHALGLWDHSDSTDDIMYPVASQSSPSRNDAWTIYQLYHTPADYTTGGRGGSAIGKHYEFHIE